MKSERTIFTTFDVAASVGPYTGDFSDPPTQDELSAFRDWANNFSTATAR